MNLDHQLNMNFDHQLNMNLDHQLNKDINHQLNMNLDLQLNMNLDDQLNNNLDHQLNINIDDPPVAPHRYHRHYRYYHYLSHDKHKHYTASCLLNRDEDLNNQILKTFLRRENLVIASQLTRSVLKRRKACKEKSYEQVSNCLDTGQWTAFKLSQENWLFRL